jgi:hypothetical protein
LLDKFHLTKADILELTDRDIHDLYFHTRTKDGEIDFDIYDEVAGTEDGDNSLEAALKRLDDIAFALKFNEQQIKDAKAKLRAKYAKQESK